jgi:hypothetical protein
MTATFAISACVQEACGRLKSRLIYFQSKSFRKSANRNDFHT